MSRMSDLQIKSLQEPETLTAEELDVVLPWYVLHHPMLESQAAAWGHPCLCLLCRMLLARSSRPVIEVDRSPLLYQPVPDHLGPELAFPA